MNLYTGLCHNKNQYVDWLVKQFDPKTSDPEVCAKKLQIGGYESISMKPEGEDGEELIQKQNQSGGGSTLKNKEKLFRLCYLPSSMSDEDKKKASDACRSWFQNSDEDKDERKQKKFENAPNCCKMLQNAAKYCENAHIWCKWLICYLKAIKISQRRLD